MTTPEIPRRPNSQRSSTNTPSRKNDLVQEWANSLEEPLITFDNLDDAILGVGRTHTQPTRIVYSYKQLVKICVYKHGMTLEEAHEFLSFNVESLWAGENTPIIMYDLDYF